MKDKRANHYVYLFSSREKEEADANANEMESPPRFAGSMTAGWQLNFTNFIIL